MGGADEGKRSGNCSINTTRLSTNSRTGVGAPKLRSREGQITTTCHFQIGRHLRFQDQGRQLRLIGGRQKQGPSNLYQPPGYALGADHQGAFGLALVDKTKNQRLKGIIEFKD